MLFMEKYNTNEWLKVLTEQVEEVCEDVEEMAASGQYPVVTLLRGYDLLETLGDWEKVSYNLEQVQKENPEYVDGFHAALKQYLQSYLANGERLYALMDMDQIKMKAAAYMGPWKRRHNEALEELEKATALWEMAKVAHQAQQEGSYWERWKTLRQVRKMAGFRLERKRTGNFVVRTFDLMQQAQSKARDAELKLYQHNVEYKCTPDVYMKLCEIIQNKYIKEQTL